MLVAVYDSNCEETSSYKQPLKGRLLVSQHHIILLIRIRFWSLARFRSFWEPKLFTCKPKGLTN